MKSIGKATPVFN